MVNDSLNSRDKQARARVKISNGQEVCSRQSDRSNDGNKANNTEISSSTLSVTVTGVGNSQTPAKTAANGIEVVLKSDGKKEYDAKHAMKTQILLKGFATEVEFPP